MSNSPKKKRAGGLPRTPVEWQQLIDAVREASKPRSLLDSIEPAACPTLGCDDNYKENIWAPD